MMTPALWLLVGIVAGVVCSLGSFVLGYVAAGMRARRGGDES